MRNPLKTDRSAGLGMLAARLPIGAFFLVLGYVKLHGGVDIFVSHNIANVPGSIPRDWGMHYLQAVPFAEVAVGAMLILGLMSRLAGFVGALMVTSFTIGATGWKSEGLPFHPNLIYIGLLLAVFLVGPGRISIDGLLFKKRSSPPPSE